MRVSALFVVALALAGCTNPAGASQLAGTRLSYNEAIARSGSEQLLLNLVRLRFLHAPQFFEVTSVTTQGTIRGGGAIGATGTIGDPPSIMPTIGGSFEWEETPTITYEPLQGQEFAQRLVSPIAADTVMQLVQVGWRIDSIFACCVQRVNGLSSPIIASRDPGYGGEAFLRVGALLYQLQIHQALEIDVVRRGDGPAEVFLVFAPTDDPRLQAAAVEARSLLGLDPSRVSFRVYSSTDPMAALPPPPPPVPVAVPEEEEPAAEGEETERTTDAPPPPPAPASPGLDHVVLRGRSLLGTLFYLSHGVQVPEGDHAARGLGYEDGERGEVEPPNPVPNALLTVLIEPPGVSAYASTIYRGHRYVIADDDLESKQTFLLMSVLFALLSAPSEGGPMLTLPVGGN